MVVGSPNLGSFSLATIDFSLFSDLTRKRYASEYGTWGILLLLHVITCYYLNNHGVEFAMFDFDLWAHIFVRHLDHAEFLHECIFYVDGVTSTATKQQNQLGRQHVFSVKIFR